MLRTALHVPDSVLPQALLEGRLTAPRRVLTTVVGEHLLRRPVLGHAAFERLEHQFGLLMVRDHVRDHEARVVVHESRHVHPLVPSQQKREDVALPHLVGRRPLEASRLLCLARARPRRLADQPLLVQYPPDRRLRDAERRQPRQHVPDLARAPVRVRVLGIDHRLSPRVAVECSLLSPRSRHVGHQAVESMVPVPSQPVAHRLRPDPKQPRRIAHARVVLEHLPDHPESKLHRVRISGPALGRCLAVTSPATASSSSLCHLSLPFVDRVRSEREDVARWLSSDQALVIRHAQQFANANLSESPTRRFVGRIVFGQGAATDATLISKLHSGDADDAIAIAKTHADRFPSAILAVERRAIERIAACKTKRAGWQDKAQAFLDAHGKTPLARKVRDACGEAVSNR